MVYIYLVNVFYIFETENIFHVLKDISATKIKTRSLDLGLLMNLYVIAITVISHYILMGFMDGFDDGRADLGMA